MVAAKKTANWSTHLLLQVLREMDRDEGHEFTRQQVIARCVRDNDTWVKSALKTGLRSGLFTLERRLDRATMGTAGHYKVTQAGAAAIRAAALGEPIRSGPKGPLKANRKRPPATFAARLWALLRARRVLDGGSAAATLIDAGDDVAAAAKTAGVYLQRWAQAGAVQECAQRLPHGRKRFALIKDTPEPPNWTTKDRAQHKAVALLERKP